MNGRKSVLGKRAVWILVLSLAMGSGSFLQAAQEAPTNEEARDQSRGGRQKKERLPTLKEVTVIGRREERKPFLADLDGTKIYAGKKTSLIDLQERPPVTHNNYRQVFVKTPGLLLSEETTPLFSLGYRGLNPDRAQFIQVMKDGIPIVADLFGYPEAYYTPPLQTIEEIEFIRGGSALMYGPQPGGALNYVTQKPVTDKKLVAYSENVFGTDDYFSTYEGFSGSLGPVGYLGYLHERQGDGFRRENSDFEVISAGTKVTVNQTGDSRLTLAYDEYHEEHGEPGGLSRTPAAGNLTYDEDRDFTTRFFDRFVLERYYGSLLFEKDFSEATRLDLRTFGGRYRRYSKRQRGGGFGTRPAGANAGSNDIREDNFYNIGFEPRFRHDYEWLGETHTLSLGTLFFHSQSPREEERGATPFADEGLLLKASDRDMWYSSLFLENRFQWRRLSVTPGVRLEHIWQRIEEKRNLDKTTVPLGKETEFDFVPLFGLGIAYEVFDGVEAYTNISQSYRPKLFAEAVPLGTNEAVNGDLKEGFAWQYDFGLRGKPVSFFSWDIDYFILDFNDQTGTVGNTVENVGDSFHQGMELSTEVDVIQAYDFVRNSDLASPLGSLTPFFTLAILDAEFNEGPNQGRQPQFAPQYNLRFGVDYRWRDRVKMSLLGTWVDDHSADDAGTLNRIIPSYKVWDLTGEVKLFEKVGGFLDVSFFGGIQNLFDEDYYARITGAGIDPAYRRNLYGGLKARLG